MQNREEGESRPFANGAGGGRGGKVRTLADCYDDSVPRGFVNKVLALVGIQVAFMTAYTFGCIHLVVEPAVAKAGSFSAAYGSSPAMQFMANQGCAIAMVAYLGSYCALMCCCPNLRRQVPANYILMTLLALGVSHIVMVAAMMKEIKTVYLAFGATTVLCFGLILYAMRTETDLTGWGMYFFAFFIGMFGFGLVLGLLSMCGVISAATYSAVDYAMAFIWLGFFSIYLVYHIQLVRNIR